MTDHERIGRFVSEVGRAFPAPPASIHRTAPRTGDMLGQEKIDRFCSEITRCFYAPQNKQEPNIMAFEQRDNSGSVWVNDRKTADNHPDRTGSAKINGEDFWVHGWLKKTKDGKPYLSLAFKKKNEQPAASNKSRADDMSDSIPF